MEVSIILPKISCSLLRKDEKSKTTRATHRKIVIIKVSSKNILNPSQISPSEISSNCINFNHMLIKKFSDFFCLMGISSENVSFWVVTCFSATDTHHPLRAFQARQGLAETYSEIHHNSPKLYDHIKNVLPVIIVQHVRERIPKIPLDFKTDHLWQ